jgi:hypothetical protein
VTIIPDETQVIIPPGSGGAGRGPSGEGGGLIPQLPQGDGAKGGPGAGAQGGPGAGGQGGQSDSAGAAEQ